MCIRDSAGNLRVTQLVDGNKGIHAMLKKPNVAADGTLHFGNR